MSEKQQKLQDTLQNAVLKAAEENRFDKTPPIQVSQDGNNALQDYTQNFLAELEMEELNQIADWQQSSDVGNLGDVEEEGDFPDRDNANRLYITAKRKVTRYCNIILKEIDMKGFQPYEAGAKLEKAITAMVETGGVAIALAEPHEIDKIKNEFSERAQAAAEVILELQKRTGFLPKQDPTLGGAASKPTVTFSEPPRAGPESGAISRTNSLR